MSGHLVYHNNAPYNIVKHSIGGCVRTALQHINVSYKGNHLCNFAKYVTSVVY